MLTSKSAVGPLLCSFIFVACLCSSMPAHAQATGNEYTSTAATGVFGETGSNTGTGTTQFRTGSAPTLAGATSGTIGPQGTNATYVSGLNTAGTVRVNNLANMEALLNIMSNGTEVLGIAWGGPTLIMAFMELSAGGQAAPKKIIGGLSGIVGALAAPGWDNWLVACARDANLFN